MNESLIKIDGFFSSAKKLRQEFESVFRDPLQAPEKRFFWDHWYVPDQYHLHRTHPHQFFSSDIYEALEVRLCEWGRDHLGCDQISTPWLSYYSHDCEQRLHADNPHGPWAFVYSLTKWDKRTFSGGETLILNDQTLDYWNHADFSSGLETSQLYKRVSADFDRLIVFDPRSPHGVSRVSGSHDPLQARLVLHGWFMMPEPRISGGLEDVELSEYIGPALGRALDSIESHGEYNGYVLFTVIIEANGSTKSVQVTGGNLKSISRDSARVDEVCSELIRALQNLKYPESKIGSELNLPLVFK